MSTFVVFDTEFTAWPGSRERQWSESWEHREIIQLAAIKVEQEGQHLKVIESFNELVLPRINPQLSDYVTQLTGIEQHMLTDMAVDFPSALNQFHAFCSSGALPGYSWGNDQIVLKENCRLNSLSWPEFYAGLYDIKPILKRLNIEFTDTNSGRLAQSLGIELSGKEHNALHDVRSIVAALQHWVTQEKLQLSQLISQ